MCYIQKGGLPDRRVAAAVAAVAFAAGSAVPAEGQDCPGCGGPEILRRETKLEFQHETESFEGVL